MFAKRFPILKRRFAATIEIASWIYLAILASIAVAMRWKGDVHWQMTMLTFGPRWVSLVPLVPLSLGSLLFRRRALVPVVLGFACSLLPVMGLCIPWRALYEKAPVNALALRVVSANIDRDTDLEKLFEFIKETDPDVIAFQEGPFVRQLIRSLRDKYHFFGTRDTFVASRFKFVEREVAPRSKGRDHSPSVRCEINTPQGVVVINCIHLYTLRSGFMSVIAKNTEGGADLEHVLEVHNEESGLASELAKKGTGPTLVMGDFNTTCESAIFRRDWSSWEDAFARRGWGFGYTFSADRIHLRIDHILADSKHWSIRSCRVGPDLKGQHRPVIADLMLIPGENIASKPGK